MYARLMLIALAWFYIPNNKAQKSRSGLSKRHYVSKGLLVLV